MWLLVGLAGLAVGIGIGMKYGGEAGAKLGVDMALRQVMSSGSTERGRRFS